MDNKSHAISPTCRRRLHMQGYENYSDEELGSFKLAIRFAYGLCITLVAAGLISGSVHVLGVAALIAFVGAFPPYHPFDYLYNHGVRQLLNKPKAPHRTNQGRFACGIAAAWLGLTILMFHQGHLITGYILGVSLLAVGGLVTTTDICIPSMIYNRIFRKASAGR